MTDRDPHVRLVTAAQVAIVAIVLVGALVAMIPGSRLDLRTHAADDSDTALMYARLALAENPSDADAREAYVRRLARLGRFADALAAWSVLERQGTPGDAASLLGLQIAHECAIAASPGTPARTRARLEVERRIRALRSADLSDEARERIVAIGRAHDLGSTVAKLLEAQARRARNDELMHRAADAYLAAGNPGRAGKLRIETLDSLPSDDAVATALMALDELCAAGETEFAAATLDRLTDRFASHPEVWASAIDVGGGGGAPPTPRPPPPTHDEPPTSDASV